MLTYPLPMRFGFALARSVCHHPPWRCRELTRFRSFCYSRNMALPAINAPPVSAEFSTGEFKSRENASGLRRPALRALAIQIATF